VAVIDAAKLTKTWLHRLFTSNAWLPMGTAVAATQTVQLQPLTRNVEFDYTALSLAEPRKVQFRYKLEGFDTDWRTLDAAPGVLYESASSRLSFPGAGLQQRWRWNESGATLDFDLLPAFYQTQWFRLLCALF